LITSFTKIQHVMNYSQQYFAKYWERQRQLGQWKFVGKTAVRWGIFMWLFNGLFLAIMEPGVTLATFREVFFSVGAVLRLGIWALASVLYALLTWYWNERQYQKGQE